MIDVQVNLDPVNFAKFYVLDRKNSSMLYYSGMDSQKGVNEMSLYLLNHFNADRIVLKGPQSYSKKISEDIKALAKVKYSMENVKIVLE